MNIRWIQWVMGLFFGLAVSSSFAASNTHITTFKDCPDCPEMVVIPSGAFMMGRDSNLEDGDDDELPRHEVQIKKFAVGKFEVTQAEYIAVMEHNPSRFKGRNNPVENISWHDAQEYVAQLSQKTGKTYRLLSESEWEYAARAGTNTLYSFGDDLSDLEQYAWFDGNSQERTHPVGQKQPNGFGLYDMHGNVWEWVADCYNASYHGAPNNGEAWISESCKYLLSRGGSWDDIPYHLRSGFRARDALDYTNDNLGFRVARTLP